MARLCAQHWLFLYISSISIRNKYILGVDFTAPISGLFLSQSWSIGCLADRGAHLRPKACQKRGPGNRSKSSPPSPHDSPRSRAWNFAHSSWTASPSLYRSRCPAIAPHRVWTCRENFSPLSSQLGNQTGPPLIKASNDADYVAATALCQAGLRRYSHRLSVVVDGRHRRLDRHRFWSADCEIPTWLHVLGILHHVPL